MTRSREISCNSSRALYASCMEELLTRVASDQRTPAAGSAAAAVAALAAALVTKAARRSRDVWPEAGGSIAQAAALDARLREVAEGLEQSYQEAIGSLQAGDADAIAQALPQAAQDPLELARVAADIGLLAVEAAHRCDQAHHADVTVAAMLAEAAARSAAHLVDVNLLSRTEDARSSEARMLVARAAEAAATLASED
jgi:formiminotetrahydrofolate cyclodeaminase